jgi:hypothetical protein
VGRRHLRGGIMMPHHDAAARHEPADALPVRTRSPADADRSPSER